MSGGHCSRSVRWSAIHFTDQLSGNFNKFASRVCSTVGSRAFQGRACNDSLVSKKRSDLTKHSTFFLSLRRKLCVVVVVELTR